MDPSVPPRTKTNHSCSGWVATDLLSDSLHKNRVGLHGKAWTEFKKYLSAADRHVLPASLIKVYYALLADAIAICDSARCG